MPDDFTKVKAFKVTCNNLKLLQNQKIVISFKATTPVGTETGLSASNSFAVLAYYYNTSRVLTPFLPVEPNVATVKIAAPEKTVTLGGLVWNDVNKNGLIDSGEPGINNVTVELYDSKGTTLLQTTITAYDFNGNAGYYAFGDLTPDCYTIKLFLPSGYRFTAENIGTDMSKNSSANPKTGFTEQECLQTVGASNMNINAGLILIVTSCQAINDIFESVALEQTAIAHILNAEGEKLQMVLNMANVSQEQLLKVNSSVKNMVDSISRLEIILQNKLGLFKQCACDCTEKV